MITASQFQSMSRNSDVRGTIVERLDRAIKHAAERCETTIRVQVAPLWPRQTIDDVLVEYAFAGWAARVVDDSRDGDFIELQVRS